jgi:hypothetical protein
MHAKMPIAENPFCTRRIRPGSVEYFFPAGVAVEDLIDRLRRNCWQGEIVGPHGSGKSALLARLFAAVEQAGRKPVLFELHDGQRRLPNDWTENIKLPQVSAPPLIVVDGYEQLSLWNRFFLKRYCRRRNIGLLVTSHVPTGLPEIFKTTASLEIARQIVEQLMQNQPMKIPPEIIADLFALHNGDIREMLFDLYDLYERMTAPRSE